MYVYMYAHGVHELHV